MDKDILVEISNVSKNFGVTRALDHVSFHISRGEVRGFIGENGSGKSTLSNIIAGVYVKDEGEIIFDGVKHNPQSVIEAEKAQIALIIQEIGTIGEIDVASNIFLGNEKKFKQNGFINYRQMYEEAQRALSGIEVTNIDVKAKAGSLNLEERKIVEIAKAMYISPKLLIVDETSNALSAYGRTILYRAIKTVKESGGTVLFITHDLEEMLEVCDSVTILRDGIYIDTIYGADMDIDAMKVKMVGREISKHYYRDDDKRALSDEVVLSARGIYTSALSNIDLQVCKGEILGIGGLSDCGMHELGRILFGLDKPFMGEVICEAAKTNIKSPEQAIANSIGYISKNRDTEAVILQSSIKDNVCLCSLKKLSTAGFATPKKEELFVSKWVSALNVKCQGIHQYVSALSGGNKQKVVLAKWLGYGSEILIMDCPTRGIDIGVKEAIYKLMIELKESGHSMILISEELPELIGMSDRILILKDGKQVSEYDRGPDITEALLIKDML